MRHHVRLSVHSGRVFNAFSIPLTALLMIAGSTLNPSTIHAASFQPTTTPTDWIVDSNWDTNSTPNAVGATATFAAAPAAFQTVNLASDVTVGSITFNTTGTNPVSIGAANATGGRLILDAAGAGPVVITSAGAASFGSTGSNTDSLAATMVFNDDVIIDVENTIAHATTGGFRLGGPVTGTGGLTKTGPGLMTWAFTPSQTGLLKAYQGPTALIGGRVRMSSGAAPNATSSFTIDGGQLDPISTNTFYTFGASSATPLKLSGFGPTTGPYAAFPGVIRPDTNFVIGITNDTELVTDSMLHMQGTATGSLVMSGAMSGKGILYAGATAHDANLGKITLQGSNSYTGGTIVSAGTLIADGASTHAFGTGSVQVVSANAAFGGAQAHLRIAAGATDAIANTAYLNLAGGNAAGSADDGYADLDAGVTETVAGLMLGGTIMPIGTYGSSASGATFQNDEYFSGTGIINNAATGVPGDYNNNGVVDAGDEVLWKKGVALANDFTPGNQASDYDFWRSRFGATTNPGSGSGLANTSVPEPSTIAMVGLAAAALIVRRRRPIVLAT